VDTAVAPSTDHAARRAAARVSPAVPAAPVSEPAPGQQTDELHVDTEQPGVGAMPDFDEPFPVDERAPASAAAHQPMPQAEVVAAPVSEETEVSVEFDKTDLEHGKIEPPPVKRVQLSNQMDILAELEGLRKQATMGGGRWSRPADRDVDIESLLAGSDPVRELRERVHESLNSDIFKNMRGVQLAVRIHNQDGETIHALDPITVAVSRAGKLEKLSLRFIVDLENKR
jgi:hypothetical protein